MSQKRALKNQVCINFQPRTFTFLNGHSYTGQFLVDTSNNLIFRHGYGTYDNSDGLKISGNWIRDKISGEVTIEYSNVMKFQGFLSKNMAYTVGEIYFADGSKLYGDFNQNFQNRRIDSVNFIDPNGKKWKLSLTEENEIFLQFDWQQDEPNCDTASVEIKQ